MSDFYFMVQQSLIFIVPLLIVALGGMFSEKSGVINIALEGIMIIGAFVGIMFISIMQKQNNLSQNPQILLLLAALIAMIAGIIFSSLLAYASINLRADQVIGGTALNLLAPALVIFIARTRSTVKQVYFDPVFGIKKVPFLGDIPLLGDMFFKNTYITIFLGFLILIISYVVIYKTRFGLRLSACGEHPHAAASVGVNVYKMRWAGVLISGALAGLGGLIYIVPVAVSFSGDVGGYGFLALAVMIFGEWKPLRIFLAAIFFGFFKALSSTYIIIDFIMALKIPNIDYLFKMVPYIATLIVLIFTSKKSRAPKAEGIPYNPGAR